MPAGKTYEPIATTTFGSASTGVTFSSVPQTYTDLIIIVTGNTTAGPTDNNMQFNGDTSANYSVTGLYGDGGAGASFRSAASNMETGGIYWGTGIGSRIMHIMNYANTTTYKTVLTRSNPGNSVESRIGLWRSTSAITSIYVYVGASTYTAGTTITLYGIAAA